MIAISWSTPCEPAPADCFCEASQVFRALCRCISVVHQGQFWANSEQIGYIIDALKSGLTANISNAKGEPLLSEREGQLANFARLGSQSSESLPSKDGWHLYVSGTILPCRPTKYFREDEYASARICGP